MKKIAFLLLLLSAPFVAFTQTQIATLQHGEALNFYYGANAFVNAYNAAQNGDLITLSSGSFAGTNITKAITLHGAGCLTNPVSGTLPTIIAADFTMNVADDAGTLSIEGVYFSGEAKFIHLLNPVFVKCNFESFASNGTSNNRMSYAQFVDCKMRTFNFSHTNNTLVVNCIIWSTQNMSNINYSVESYNSIIQLMNSGVSALTAYNCILIDGTTINSMCLDDNSIAYNCIGIGNNNIFNSVPHENCMISSYDDVFETFEGSAFTFDEPFLLTEETATDFLGTDGTQVGIYGGTMPYDPRPSYQIVKHYNVPNKSDNEGNLNVDIEIYPEAE